jgi:hypothetical protein
MALDRDFDCEGEEPGILRPLARETRFGMPVKRRGTPADQLARDYCVSLNEFATAVIDVIVESDPADDVGRGAAHRREVCAAVSAAMTLALDASMLSDVERSRLEPLIRDVLLPFWLKHCNQDADAASYITARYTHYTSRRIAGSQVKTAVNLVSALLDALAVPEPRRSALSERLVPAFAHRLVGDIFRINDVRARHGIDLSMLATVCALLQMSISYDPILRALRIG